MTFRGYNIANELDKFIAVIILVESGSDVLGRCHIYINE